MRAVRPLWAGLGLLLLLLGLWGGAPRAAQGAGSLSLRFYGHGLNDIDRVKIPIDPAVPADVGADFTLEFWLKANLAENRGVATCGANIGWVTGNILLDRDIYGAGDYGDFGVSLTNGRLAFGVSRGANGNTVCSSGVVADGQWHHVALTRQASTGQLRIFVDGLQAGQANGPTGDVSYRDGRTGQTNDPYLVLGAEKHDAGAQFPSFSGWLDELRISTGLRYTADFTPPAGPFTADAGTAALYHFDEGPAGACTGTVLDSSGAAGGPSHGQCRYGGSGTAGPVYSTDTPAGLQATATLTPTATATPSVTPSATATDTATATATWTPSATPSATGTDTATATPTATQTPSITPSATATDTATATPAATQTPSATGTDTATATPTATQTPSITPSATATDTATATATETPSATPSAAATDTATATPAATQTPSATGTDTATATPTATQTPSATPSATAAETQTPTVTRSPTATPTPPAAGTAVASATAFVPATGSRRLYLPLVLAPPAAPAGRAAAPAAADPLYLPVVLNAAGPADGYALRFFGHGVSDIDRVKIRLDAPARPVDVSGDFTVEFWLKADAGANTSSNAQCGTNDGWIYGNIVVDRDIYGAGDYGDYGVALSAGRMVFGASVGGGGNTLCGGGVVADGQWHHVALTRQASTGQLRIYVDGQLDAQGSGPAGNLSYRDGRGGQPDDPYLVLGAEKHDAGAQFPSFSGWLDELRVSTTLRYTGNFTPSAAPFTSDAGTAALYHFDEGPAGACTGIVLDNSGAAGGPSNGQCRYGGSGTAGPVYDPDQPFP